ncbi:hypothetical protein H9P43_009929 [Blastocladiella emersonii ATCC 22665]|nr:hypothetical protein H9P43_009929 [Blastocladiella emersonii ATCC 22665]
MAPKKAKLKTQLNKFLATHGKQAKKDRQVHHNQQTHPKSAVAGGKLKGKGPGHSKNASKPAAAPATSVAASNGGDESSAPAAAAVPAPGQRHDYVPYTLDDTILLVGEGNFSFARAVAQVLGSGANVIATAYDDEATVAEKYPDAAEIIADLKNNLDGTVLFGIDATALNKVPALKGKTFSKIVFNFPHVGLGIKNQDRNVRANQELLLKFFKSSTAISSLTTEFVVTVKAGNPYDLWGVKRLAKMSGLITKASFPFFPDLYPGYEHRRTLGFDAKISAAANAEIRHARTYIFATANDEILARIEAAQTGEKIDAKTLKRKAAATAALIESALPPSKRARTTSVPAPKQADSDGDDFDDE